MFSILPIANRHSLWTLRGPERTATRFHHLPKRQIRIARVASEVLCRHSKWESLELNFFLPALECFVNKSVDFFHCIICHRVTTNGSTAAVHHEKAAGSSERAIIGVGKTSIEREIFARIGIHLSRSDVIKTFGRLMVSLHKLRPKIS